MPGKIDEVKWNKAKKLAQDEGKGDNYAYIQGIYQKMIGKEAMYNGKEVELNKPFRLSGDQKVGEKTHGVYVMGDNGNVILVKFGHEMKDRNDNPERKKAFDARHNCDEKKDKTKPGYWSCKQWESLKEFYEEENPNTIRINVPTITRLFEYMLEDAKDDIELHKILERLIEVSVQRSIIKMEDYEYIVTGKMELSKEITELEKTMEAIDKSKNPIEANPENKRNKGVVLDEDNVPEDKEPSDKIEDEGYIYKKTKESLCSSIKSFNEILDRVEPMKERRVYISDPFEAPPGANVQVGPHGGYYYEAESEQKFDDMAKDDKKKKDDKKDLAKTKED